MFPTSRIFLNSTCFGRTWVCAADQPVRAYLPELFERVWNGRIQPGKVVDLTLPLDQVAEAYASMDGRRSVKAMLIP